MKKPLPFAKAQEEGKIKHIGLSEVHVADIKKAQEFFEVVSVQNMYSVDNRKWETELQYCKDNDIAFIPWFPLSGGNMQAMEVIEKIAKAHDATTHQVALNWLLQHAPNVLLIPGTSSVAHLEDNMKTADLVLTVADMDELDRIAG